MTPQKTALVTGASRGIGRAIAVELAKSGFQVAVHYQSNRTAAEETLRLMPGRDHVLLAADLAEPNASEALAQEARHALGGRVDVLVHNAGIYEPTPLLTGCDFLVWQESMRRQMQVNFWAGADLAYQLAPAMADAGWGRIIQISSRAGHRGEARHAGYAASKAAQDEPRQITGGGTGGVRHRVFRNCAGLDGNGYGFGSISRARRADPGRNTAWPRRTARRHCRAGRLFSLGRRWVSIR